jgi:endogenous inhibitor of DNA gyrase (YacG/DUF329 family)
MSVCPNCQKDVPEFKTEQATITTSSAQVDALAITCPECQTIIGAINNPSHTIDIETQKKAYAIFRDTMRKALGF